MYLQIWNVCFILKYCHQFNQFFSFNYGTSLSFRIVSCVLYAKDSEWWHYCISDTLFCFVFFLWLILSNVYQLIHLKLYWIHQPMNVFPSPSLSLYLEMRFLKVYLESTWSSSKLVLWIWWNVVINQCEQIITRVIQFQVKCYWKNLGIVSTLHSQQIYIKFYFASIKTI